MNELPSTKMRARNITLITPKRHFLFPWAWLHRIELNCEDGEMSIAFPGRVVRLKGTNLHLLLKDIDSGKVSEIAGKLAPASKEKWSVQSIIISDADNEFE